jgi:hypothetical protein
VPPRPVGGVRPLLTADVLRVRANVEAGREPLDDACKRLLAQVRERCPQLLPRDPVPHGTLTEPVTVDADAAQRVVQLGVAAAAGLDPRVERRGTVLWRKGDLQLLVRVSAVKSSFEDGVVEIAIPVACDEERGTVVVTFAVGGPQRVAGLLAATHDRPRGPATIVTLWSDELIALAWHGLLEAISGLAGAAGRDVDDAALIPGALAVANGALTVLPMARHAFDRA